MHIAEMSRLEALAGVELGLELIWSWSDQHDVGEQRALHQSASTRGPLTYASENKVEGRKSSRSESW